MKKVLLSLAVFALINACKKADHDAPSVSEPKLMVDPSFVSTSHSTPSATILVGTFIYHTGNTTTEPIYIGTDFEGQTAGFNQVRVVVRLSATDSIVLTDDELVSANGLFWNQPISVSSNTAVSIRIYVTAPQVVFGSLTATCWVGRDGVEVNATAPTLSFGYAVAPIVTDMTPSDFVVRNGERTKLTILKIAAPTQGAIAIKQLAYRFTYADNGALDTLRFDSLTWERSGVNETELVTISDSLGGTCTALSSVYTSNRKLYATYTSGAGEIVIPAGSSETFVLEGTAQGFGPAADADAVRVVPVIDYVLPNQNYVYLNKGTVGAMMKLYSTPNQTSAANSSVQNLLWSSLEGIPHSAIPGVSSNDWHNGYGIPFTVTANIFHSRPTGTGFRK